MSQDDEGTIIDRVCTLIAPCVSIENVQKNLTSIALYVRFLWNDTDRAQFLALFPSSNSERLDPKDLANLLLLSEDHPNIRQIFALCARHPLIMNRIFRLKSITLKDPASVAKNLEFTNRNVDWQLRRIYRVRNAIVHTGSSEILLPQLTQHLHCYMVKAIKSILTEMDRNPKWGIQSAGSSTAASYSIMSSASSKRRRATRSRPKRS